METAQNPDSGTLSNEPQAVVVRREPERDLVVWNAPARPFKRYGRKFYVTIFSIVGIISIILFIAEGIMPVILMVSLIFLFYVLSTVPPETIENKVTSRGIKIAGKDILWQNISKFCFVSKAGGEVLVLETLSLPGRMELVVNPEIKDVLKREISAFVPYEDLKTSTLDKVTSWVIKKLPDSE